MGKSKLLDFDPEALLDPAPSSSDNDEHSGVESEDDGQAGREHYADIGKSRLRKTAVVPLGPQYTGAKISRDAIEEEHSDDPFAKGMEWSEDDSEDEGGIAHGVESGDDDEVFDVDDVDSDEELGSGPDQGDQDDDEEEEDQDTSGTSSDGDEDKNAKLREMMRDTTLVASALSQATQTDIEKGNAVKHQRKTFDTLLNARVRLQKALISTNSLSAEPHSKSKSPTPAIEAAEAAALTLLNNLTDLRSTLDSARAGQKRKRTPFTPSTLSSELHAHLAEAEKDTFPHRTAVLEKWSLKTRSAALSSSKGRLTAGNAQQTISDVLASQLQDPARLIARTQVPRSCAPLQSAARMPSSEHIYDDADFYSLLLKELLENRSSELGTGGSATEFVVQAPWQLAREARTKKVVDTRASKGRKLRYTVHEKLQNFMAPEERGTWGERQRDELFGGLFGRRVGLGEEVESEEEGEGGVEEEGLMLFRS